ncbi:MAG: RlmE family RNA methyltransferase [Planctomycetes bacterium]|nr:RlmE family RNA methyltransferase [Planctomycetota bacterium]
MSSQRVLHDHFFREAKRNGYRSRAAYKLTEIDDKRNILQKKDFVLDLGAAPGSWLQVASKRVGPRGRIIGVDLQEISNLQLDNVTTIQEDVTELSLETFGDEMFDVVLSDMAPSTTGNRTIDHHGSVRLCHTALDISATLLKPSGNLVMKVLEGGAYKELLERCESCFSVAKGFKPKASRAISTEMFIVCTGRREDMQKPMDVAPPRPSSGW